MAAPAPRRVIQEAEREPPVDPYAVQRRLRRERARRQARFDREREQRLAQIRFLFLLGALVFLTLFLSLSVWEKVTALFGL
jgi:hypothetical protein